VKRRVSSFDDALSTAMRTQGPVGSVAGVFKESVGCDANTGMKVAVDPRDTS
jgi:hypothetical protein